MAKYAFALKSTKYGTPTGSNTKPGALIALPDTVKGSVTFEESDGTTVKFNVDQKVAPIRKTKTEAGELMVTMQFYDISYEVLEAIKGGTAVAAVPATSPAKYQSPVTLEDIELFLQLELESEQYFYMYNAFIEAKITGKGSRDGMLAVEMKATAQLSADLAGAWDIEDVNTPSA